MQPAPNAGLARVFALLIWKCIAIRIPMLASGASSVQGAMQSESAGVEARRPEVPESQSDLYESVFSAE